MNHCMQKFSESTYLHLKKGENVIIYYSAVLQPRASWLNQTAGGPGTIIRLTPHNSMSDPGGEAQCLKQSKA